MLPVGRLPRVLPPVLGEALERLWDAWERLKSLADPDKKRSVKIILDAVATEPSLRARLEAEAMELNTIGNSHLTRHSEISQVPVIDVDHVDYLFHRLFAMSLMTRLHTIAFTRSLGKPWSAV